MRVGFAGSARGTTSAFVFGLSLTFTFLWPVHPDLWFPGHLSVSTRLQPLRSILTLPELSSLRKAPREEVPCPPLNIQNQ